MAAKKLQRLEKELEEEDDKDSETTLIESLADKTKVVMLVVDKWFVDKGFGFGKVPVNDDARAQGRYRARRSWGQTAWKEEKGQGKGEQSGSAGERRSGAHS